MFRTVFVSAVAILCLLVLAPPLILVAAVTKNTEPLYRVSMACTRMVLRLAGVQVEVTGKQNIPLDGPVVFMSNHQSNCDPPALVVQLPPVLIMAKKEFFRIPILGLGMRMHGFIPVERESRERAFAAVDRAVELLKKGHSFLVFPEGTRSPDGRLQPFKKGVFYLAIEAGAPIVPISISGAQKVMPKGKSIVHPGTVKMTIHRPIQTASYTLKDREQVMERVRQAIISGLAPGEQPLSE